MFQPRSQGLSSLSPLVVPREAEKRDPRNEVGFVSEKNICEHAIVCVKIVAECKEYALLETVAIQDTQDRVFFFIRYLYPDEIRPETRKRPKKWADLCEAKVREPSRISSISDSSLL